MRLRILQIMATPGGIGGLEKHTLSLCGALAERHEVHLAADVSYEPACPTGVQLHRINFHRHRFNPLLLGEIGMLLGRLQPQIVHAQAGKAARLVRWARLFYRQAVFVATVHGTKKQKSAYAAMDRIIAVSPQIAGHFPRHEVEVIYNGVERFRQLTNAELETLREKLGAVPGIPLVVAVGRLAEVKGFDILLKACTAVQMQLLIIGDGPERSRLTSICRELGLEKRVTFLGHRSDVRSILQSADACVISSRREGFPLVLVEALQAGCPVISTRVSGAVEWVPPGLLAEPGNASDLQRVLTQSLANLPALKASYEPVFEKARRELTIDRMADRTESVYLRALSVPQFDSLCHRPIS